MTSDTRTDEKRGWEKSWTKDLEKWPRYQKQHSAKDLHLTEWLVVKKRTMAKNGFKRKAMVPDRKELTTILLTHTKQEHKLLGTKAKLPMKIADNNNKKEKLPRYIFFKK